MSDGLVFINSNGDAEFLSEHENKIFGIAYQRGYAAGREAAAKVCDERARQHRNAITLTPSLIAKAMEAAACSYAIRKRALAAPKETGD